MGNMSYCRFENTLADFRDCFQALRDLAEGEGKISRREKKYALTLVLEASELLNFLADYGSIDVEELVTCDTKLQHALENVLENPQNSDEIEEDNDE